MKKKIALMAFGLVFVLAIAGQYKVSAAYAPYFTYEYNAFDGSVAAPPGYTPSDSISAATLGLKTSFNSLNDIYFDNKDTIYILDSGNSRIIAVDTKFNIKKVYNDFCDKDRNKIDFTGAGGMTVGKDGTIYVADTNNQRILLINQQCLITHIITRPDNALKNTQAAFDPFKVLVNDDGEIYVTANSINLGIFVFSQTGEFIRFWGGNEVPKTGQAMLNYIRKQFLTKTQLKSFVQATPVTIANFDIDKKGFIYTLSPYKDQSTVAEPGLLRKLNFQGQDVLDPSLVFGDIEWDRKPYPLAIKSWFNDVDIDSQGFINLLDPPRGKVFQYTDSGQLISVFGALGDQTGCLSAPTAIESVENKIYVTDAKKNCIYGFSPTSYVETLRKAVIKMNYYDLNGSLTEWNTILSKNSNSIYAYKGIGRVYDAKGDYQKAMLYFKLANDRPEYSKSFVQYRKIFMEHNYIWLLLAAVVLLAFLIITTKLIAKYSIVSEGSTYSKLESKYTFPIYTMFHPTDGFSQFKFRNNTSIRLSFGIIIAWFFTELVRYFATGVPFNTNQAIDFNPLITLTRTVGIFVLFAVANWAMCTLLDGKGTFKEIIATVSYSLIPYILSIFINTCMSNALVIEESVFMGIVSTIGIMWSFLLLFCGLLSIHQYSFSKTIFSIILTLLGIVIIVFLIILLYGLLQQAFNFLISVYNEALLRF
jgi:tetratricopeptide (TPR) repeat protein